VVRKAVAAAYRKAWGYDISADTLRDAVTAPEDTWVGREGAGVDSEAVVFTEYAGLSQYGGGTFWRNLERELRPHGLHYEWVDGGVATIWPIHTTRTAAWGNLPEGWTDESVQSFWDSITGDVKHKITKCMKQMEGKVTDTGAFCGSLASQVGYRAASGGWTPERRLLSALSSVADAIAHASLLARETPHTRQAADRARQLLEAAEQVLGRDVARDLSLPSYRTASGGTMDATAMRRAAIRVAHEDPSARGAILARMPRTGTTR
jgi:hypothetical protein